MSGFIIQTASSMYRAPEGARYPWTDDVREAYRFPSLSKARATVADHARFTERPATDYLIWHELPDGSLEREAVTTGGRMLPFQPEAD